MELRYSSLLRIHGILLITVGLVFQLAYFFKSSELSIGLQLTSYTIVILSVIAIALMTKRIYIKTSSDYIVLKLSPLKKERKIYHYDISEILLNSEYVLIRYGSQNTSVRVPLRMFRSGDAARLVARIKHVII